MDALYQLSYIGMHAAKSSTTRRPDTHLLRNILVHEKYRLKEVADALQ
ncbi:MAG TPA: hypothetical protein VGE62_03255 [Candidatus Paceibacterota bacterium]